MKTRHNNQTTIKVFFAMLCSFALLSVGMTDMVDAQRSVPECPGYEKPEIKKFKNQRELKPTEEDTSVTIEKEESMIITMEIGPKLIDCVGVAPQLCMQVKEDPDSGWELFYDGIAGFEFEQGFHYLLKVKTTQVIDPPDDGSSTEYELVEVLRKIHQSQKNTFHQTNRLNQVYFQMC